MKYFTGKKPKAIKPAEPRTMEEINKEYTEVVTKAGLAQFHAELHTRDVARFNQRLIEINAEANARTELDKQQTTDAV